MNNERLTLALKQEDFPWLFNTTQIVLSRHFYDSQFSIYLGSTVGFNKKLKELAEHLGPYDSEAANRLFIGSAKKVVLNPGSLRRFDGHGKNDGITPFWDCSGSVRVFMARLINIENVPVVVKLAVVKKAEEPDALQLLTGIRRRTAEEKCR